MFALQLDRRAHQRHPMVLIVVGDEAQGLVLVDDVTVKDGAVPVAHLVRLTSLKDDVGKFRISGHGCSNLPAQFVHRCATVAWDTK